VTRERNVLLGAGGVLAVLAIVGFVLPGRASDVSLTQPAVSAPATPIPASGAAGAVGASPSAAAGDCAGQLQSWSSDGATRQLTGLGSDISSLGESMTQLASDLENGDDASGDEATVQSDAAQVESAAQAVQGDPAPSCVPGLRSDLNSAAEDYNTAAIDATNGLNELSSDNLSVASSDVAAASTAIQRGSTETQAASSAINNFGGQS
jgi:hypothetical protein